MCTKTLQTDNAKQIKTALTHEAREDEEEFQFKGIPIAGENDGDSEESWERESWDKGDESETDNDSFTNNFQTVDTSTGEESPRVPHPRTVHILATEEIAFRVGPRKDGIVKSPTTLPFVLTTNYYQPLADDTLVYPPVPIHFIPLPDRRTWFSTRADAFQRLVESQTVTPITNAQKLAHPWKINKQEINRQHKQKLDRIIDASVQYINNPAALLPPTLTHTHCWTWQAPETSRSHSHTKPTLSVHEPNHYGTAHLHPTEYPTGPTHQM